MIAFQWRPPWREIIAATCKHSRSSIKGKAPENCACLQVPARSASSWTQVPLAGGAVASTSTAIPSSPDIDFLFFYPSFYYDVAAVKARRIKYFKRALRRSLGISRSQLPSGSTSRQIFADRKPPPFRHVSHSSTVLSNIPSLEEHTSERPPTFNTLPYRKTRNNLHRDDFAGEAGHESPTQSNPMVRLTEPASLPGQSSEAVATSATPQLDLPASTSQVSHLNFDWLLRRVYKMISSKGSLKRIRWRLYALFRLTDRYLAHEEVDEKELRLLVLKVCQAHLPFNDVEHLEQIIQRSETLQEHRHGFSANFQAYNVLMLAYCRALRVNDAHELLARMRAVGMRPNRSSYLALVTMFAHLRDPENAQKMVEAMNRDNIPIDQKIYASLMNAYVEAGFWDDAVRIFEYLDSHAEGHTLKPDAYTCTTLLKCYVLMGAPLEEVTRIYTSIQARGLQPRQKTNSLMLQSACDAGALDFAEDFFARLDEDEKGQGVNLFAFTIMIRGLLRAGKQDAANDYYREMRRRGIEPSSTTWSVLMQAYATAGISEDNAMLTDLLNQFLDAYVDSRTGRIRSKLYRDDRSVTRGTALENVYGPLISSTGRSGRPPASQIELSQPEDSPNAARSAVDLFRKMLNHPGTRPSLHLYTALLDAYRRVNDIAGVRELWSHILTYAMKQVEHRDAASGNDMGAGNAVFPSRRNMLCLPLSIYIEAMSSNHCHQDVAQAWQQLQSLGFGFDVGNWNHLIAAFVRAGEIDRALWLAEDVLEEGQKAQRRTAVPAYEGELQRSQLAASLDDGQIDSEPSSGSLLEGDKAETPMRPPNRAWQYHSHRSQQMQPRISVTAPLGALDPQDASPVTSYDSEPSAKDPAAVVAHDTNTASSLTASYVALRQQHHAQVWTLFASTIKLLESALRQESAAAAASREKNTDAHNLATEDPLHHHRQKYPLAIGAVEQYRSKMRVPGSRGVSRP